MVWWIWICWGFLVSAHELNIYTNSCLCHPLEGGWKRLALDDSRINCIHYLRWVKKLLFSLKKFNITLSPLLLHDLLHRGISVRKRLWLHFQSRPIRKRWMVGSKLLTKVHLKIWNSFSFPLKYEEHSWRKIVKYFIESYVSLLCKLSIFSTAELSIIFSRVLLTEYCSCFHILPIFCTSSHLDIVSYRTFYHCRQPHFLTSLIHLPPPL